MKPQPLDLEEFEIIGVKIPKKAWSVLVSGEDFDEERFRKYWKTTTEKENKYRNMIITQLLEVTKESIRLTTKEIKQRIKSACEFYLRYKDKPAVLWKEREEYRRNLIKLDKLENDYFRFDMDEYNEWLFKLAFRSVMK